MNEFQKKPTNRLQAIGGQASRWHGGWLVLWEDESIWMACSRLVWHAVWAAVNHPQEGPVCHYVHEHTADSDRVFMLRVRTSLAYSSLCLFCVRVSVNTNVCIPSSCMLRRSTLPEAASHINHSRRERTFSGPFTVTPVFKGCTRVRLVFSAVSPRPSVPFAGHRGWRLGGRWCKSQAAGRWLGSHLISARALGLWEMTTTGHTFIISMCAWLCKAYSSSGENVGLHEWFGWWLFIISSNT